MTHPLRYLIAREAPIAVTSDPDEIFAQNSIEHRPGWIRPEVSR